MPRYRIGATLLAALAATASLPVPADAATEPVRTGSFSIAPTDDAYVAAESPKLTSGTSTKILSSLWPRAHKTGYLKFQVSGIPDDATRVQARLELSSDRAQPALVRLHRVASSTWTEGALSASTAPAAGDVVAEAKPAPRATGLAFDVSRTVAQDGTYSFALSTGVAESTSSVFAKENVAGAPKLTVTWTAPGTYFGSNVSRKPGEDFTAAFNRVNSTFGGIKVVRLFNAGLPGAWPGLAAEMTDAPLVVSFKAPPGEVAAGRHDAFFAKWFASAPRDRQVWWSYWHEPEDDIEAGAYSAGEYRAAWARLDRLADAAGNPRLASTLILMCWSLEAGSGRTWTDYYAGAAVDVLGWDCYSRMHRAGQYKDPAALFGPAARISSAAGKPFAIAEFGSLLAVGDDGSRRAAWLRASGEWLRANRARFVTYFDAPGPEGDFRLNDKPSQEAWRSVVTTY